jgi:hypothetical protein
MAQPQVEPGRIGPEPHDSIELIAAHGDHADVALSPARYIIFVITMLFLCTAISGQSFWIDEANSAWRASEPNFSSLIARMTSDAGSDAQMPFFLILLWCWEKLFGHGEVALRAMNLVWLVPGIIIIAQGRFDRIAVAATSAFLWFYVDEARPYGMQIGASFMVFGLLERAVTAAQQPYVHLPLLRRYEEWLLVFALLFLAGSSLLGAIWAVAAVAAAMFAVPWPSRRASRTRLKAPLVVLIVILTPLALYYCWTILAGAGGTKVAVTDARSVMFIAYELLGVAGLGPARALLREDGTSAFVPHLPAVITFLLLAGAVTVAGIIELKQKVSPRILMVCGLSTLTAAALILLAGYILHWRVVGRHLAPALAVVLAVEAAGLSLLWRRRWGRLIAISFLVAAFLSSANIRFAPRHAKDDYRAAAAVADNALQSGDRVWWSADALAALVYKVPLGDGCQGVLYLSEQAVGFEAKLERPQLVVTSKPDIYDPQGALATFLLRNRFQVVQTFPAFQIWRAPDPVGQASCHLAG